MSSVRTTVNHFLIRWWHATKSGFYTTTGDDQLSGWTQKLQSASQSQTCTEKRSWSLTVGLLPVRSTIASESQRNHYIWEVCSANWWDAPRLAMPAASICQRHPTPVLLPGKSRGWKSLVGCSPWGLEELDTTERLHFHALEKAMATHSSTLAGESQGQWSLVGCCLWGHTELDTTDAT